MTSKGLRKDADGMNQLTNDEIREIEKGTANVVFTRKFSIRGQIYELLLGLDEYRKSGDPTGSSLMQRLEFWKASLGIIKDNWLIGVGTGDMNEAFQQQYKKMNSKLSPDQRWRSHNQFLSIFVGFGIFGFIWFLFAILFPPLTLGKFKDYFFLVFFIIAMISMIPEDTIESQMGVTFFAFFYSFFLFARKEEDKI
jgi:O-antigen ligase